MPSPFAVPSGCAPRGPEWTPSELERLAGRLAERGARALAAISLERRLEIWADTIAALLDPSSDERRRLLPKLLESSRLSPEGLCEALEVVLGGVSEAPARALAERARPAGDAGFDGVVLAGNVPGLAAQSLLPALLAGRPLLFKSASDEPQFAAAIVAALAAREPALGEAFAAVAFHGSDPDRLTAAFGPARRLIAYGGDEAVGELGRRFGDRLHAHGPKASVALVSADVEPLLVARKLARDIALFDQRGCLSVQAIYVEGEARGLLDALDWALALEHRRLPPGPIAPDAAGAVQQLRGEAALRGLATGELPLDAGTLIVETDVRFRPSPGLRTARIHPVKTLSEALAALEPWRGRLQGAALAGPAAWAVSAELEALGLSRLAQPGELQLADAGWRNGGIDPSGLFV
jgi:hypothetical protein